MVEVLFKYDEAKTKGIVFKFKYWLVENGSDVDKGQPILIVSGERKNQKKDYVVISTSEKSTVQILEIDTNTILSNGDVICKLISVNEDEEIDRYRDKTYYHNLNLMSLCKSYGLSYDNENLGVGVDIFLCYRIDSQKCVVWWKADDEDYVWEGEVIACVRAYYRYYDMRAEKNGFVQYYVDDGQELDGSTYPTIYAITVNKYDLEVRSSQPEEDYDYYYVYLMTDSANDYYKIGTSNNPEYREKTLQSEKPTIELIVSKKYINKKIAFSIERALHKTFADKRIRGEWFRLDSDDIRDIIHTLSD